MTHTSAYAAWTRSANRTFTMEARRFAVSALFTLLLCVDPRALAQESQPVPTAPVQLVVTATPPTLPVEGTVTVRAQLRVRSDLEGLVPLSAARLDLPLDVRLPWLAGTKVAPLAGASPAPPATGGVTLALGGARTRMLEQPVVEADGATWRVFEWQADLMPLAPGELVLDGEVKFATTSGFEPQLLGDPIPRDRIPQHVVAKPVKVIVTPWPAEGRTAAFQAAVGEFGITAALDPPLTIPLAPGDTVNLVVELCGRGNLATLDAPTVNPAGFHMRGWIERPSTASDCRTFLYELEVTDEGLAAIPPILFAYLMQNGTYRTVETTSIPLPAQPTGTAPRPAAQTPGAAIPAGSMLITTLLLAAIAATVVVLTRKRAKGSNSAG